MRRWRGIIGIAAAMAVLLGTAGVASGATGRAHPAQGPFNRSYVIAALSTPGGHSPIRTLGDVEVWFGSRNVQGRIARGIGWDAHCNSIGGRLRFHDHRLVPFEISQSLIGCEAAAEREDRWLTRFFLARPHWALRGDRLILRGSPGTMTLRPGTAPPGPL